MSDESIWRPATNGIELRVRLTPKSSVDRIEGLVATADGPALKARVRAVPEDGKANAALEILVSEWLDVPRRSVAVKSGGKSRVKTLAVTGNPDNLAAAIVAALSALGTKTKKS